MFSLRDPDVRLIDSHQWIYLLRAAVALLHRADGCARCRSCRDVV